MTITSFHHNAASGMAARSPDPSTKVGCVIVDHKRGVTVGAGWNHFPEGIPESWWHIRDLKYKAVVHAEAAALLNAGPAARGADMYVTHHPCRDCAKLIIAAGVRVVWSPGGPWRDDPEVVRTVDDAAELFELCGVVQMGPL